MSSTAAPLTDARRPRLTGRSLHHDLGLVLAATDPRALAELADREPEDRRDAALSLALIHDLWIAPLAELGPRVRLQREPDLAALQLRLERRLIDRLDEMDAMTDWSLPDDPVAAVRAIGARDRVPALYTWLAEDADRDDLIAFLALEGGPDGGFDDLVALCQVGLDGAAKLELATNYWDEMGDGEPSRVHTELYRRFARAVDLPVLDRVDQPVEAIERALLGSLLTTNRALQPEMIGALGLIEMQAGPRCRQVLAGMERLGFGPDACEFYREHAVTDPRHGKDWLDKVIAPLAGDDLWGPGIVRGARWRWLVNHRFLTAVAPGREAVAGAA